jgi:hypothetical protein
MKFNKRVVDDFVLKSAQIMIERDDFFFKDNATSKRDPTFVAFNPTLSNRKPLVQSLGRTNKSPDGVGVTFNKSMTANSSHCIYTLAIAPC